MTGGYALPSVTALAFFQRTQRVANLTKAGKESDKRDQSDEAPQ